MKDIARIAAFTVIVITGFLGCQAGASAPTVAPTSAGAPTAALVSAPAAAPVSAPAVASAGAPTAATRPSRGDVQGLDEKACKARGYDWMRRPGLCGGAGGCGSVCDVPTHDARKACHGGADCEGACLCSREDNGTAGAVGACSAHVFYTEVSDCACLVEGGRASYPHGCA